MTKINIVKEGLFVVFLMLIVFVIGCSSGDVGVSIFGGAKGIYTKIIIPEKDSAFPVGFTNFVPVLKIENIGKSESYGTACIFFSDQNAITGGGCECMDFSFTADEDEEMSKDLKFSQREIKTAGDYSITAITDYSYRTIAEVVACIREPTEESGCEIKIGSDGEKGVGSLKSVSSAPISINYVKQTALPVDEETITLLFSLALKNNGNGILTESPGMGSCRTSTKSLEIPIRVYIEDFPNVGFVDCGSIKLDNKNEGKATCIVDKLNLNDFIGKDMYDFKLIVEYSYEEVESNKFVVGG